MGVALADSGDRLFVRSEFNTQIYSVDGNSLNKTWTIPFRCDGITISSNADRVALADQRYMSHKGWVRVFSKKMITPGNKEGTI